MDRAPTGDDRLVEQPISSTQVWKGRFLDVRTDRVRLSDGTETSREYVVHPGAAAMIPVLPDGRILLVRQFRYAVRATFLEIPAGKLDPGEHSFDTARRELREETGYEASEWAWMTRLHPAIGFATEVMDLYLCRGLREVGQQLDAGEMLELVPTSLQDMIAMVRAGQLSDVKTQIAAFWLQRYLSGEWAWPEFSDSARG